MLSGMNSLLRYVSGLAAAVLLNLHRDACASRLDPLAAATRPATAEAGSAEDCTWPCALGHGLTA